jgi:RNA polymerase sigma-70 factor (ECF subfamily)
MLTIGHRKAVDQARSAEAQRRRDTPYEVREQRATYDGTIEEAHRNLEGQRGRKGLEALTDTQRGALELAYSGGYTHKEVAVLLDIPFGTAKTRTRDGQIRLRDNLGLER